MEDSGFIRSAALSYTLLGARPGIPIQTNVMDSLPANLEAYNSNAKDIHPDTPETFVNTLAIHSDVR